MKTFRQLAVICGLVAVLAWPAMTETVRAQTEDIRCDYPNGGERLHPGETCPIRWAAGNPGAAVDIALWDGLRGTWTEIASGVPSAAGRFDWHVPADINTGDLFRIRIQQGSGDASAALTPTFFHIAPPEMPGTSSVQAAGRNDAGRSIAVIPNPGVTAVTVAWRGGVADHIELYDVRGRQVGAVERPAGSEMQYNVSALANGAYIVRVYFVGGGIAETRLVVNR